MNPVFVCFLLLCRTLHCKYRYIKSVPICEALEFQDNTCENKSMIYTPSCQCRAPNADDLQACNALWCGVSRGCRFAIAWEIAAWRGINRASEGSRGVGQKTRHPHRSQWRKKEKKSINRGDLKNKKRVGCIGTSWWSCENNVCVTVAVLFRPWPVTCFRFSGLFC